MSSFDSIELYYLLNIKYALPIISCDMSSHENVPQETQRWIWSYGLSLKIVQGDRSLVLLLFSYYLVVFVFPVVKARVGEKILNLTFLLN